MSRAALASLVALAVLAARASAAGETPTKGVSTDGRQTLSCTEPGLCDLDTLAFEGYFFGANQSDSRAACLCSNGTRAVLAGPTAADALQRVLLQQGNEPLLGAGCWANMTWALAADFIAKCRSDVLGVNPFEGAAGSAQPRCSPECARAVAPFNQFCFASVLANDFFAFAPAAPVPTAEQATALYAACFPTGGDAAPAAAAPTGGAASRCGGTAALAAAAAAMLLVAA